MEVLANMVNFAFSSTSNSQLDHSINHCENQSAFLDRREMEIDLACRGVQNQKSTHVKNSRFSNKNSNFSMPHLRENLLQSLIL